MPFDRVVVRQMTADDLPRVARLGNSVFAHKCISYSYWSLQEMGDHLGNYPEYCLVAEVDGDFAGFILGAPHYNDIPVGHLEWLAIESNLQHLGVGQRLCDEFFTLAKRAGLPRVLSDVESTNPHAMEFMRNLGLYEHTRITFWGKDFGRDDDEAETVIPLRGALDYPEEP